MSARKQYRGAFTALLAAQRVGLPYLPPEIKHLALVHFTDYTCEQFVLVSSGEEAHLFHQTNFLKLLEHMQGLSFLFKVREAARGQLARL